MSSIPTEARRALIESLRAGVTGVCGLLDMSAGHQPLGFARVSLPLNFISPAPGLDFEERILLFYFSERSFFSERELLLYSFYMN